MGSNVRDQAPNPHFVLLIGPQPVRATGRTGTNEKGREAAGVGSSVGGEGCAFWYEYINSWAGGGFSAPCSLHRLVGRRKACLHL